MFYCASFTVSRCGPLDPPIHGKVQCLNSDFYNSQCIYTCDEGYYLEGDGLRVCQADHDWSGTKPACKRKLSAAKLKLIPVVKSCTI